MADFAERLASIREEAFGKRGKSSFARALDIPLTSYLNFENGRVPPMGIIVKMTALTRANPRWLIHGKGPRYLPQGLALPQAEDTASVLADLLEENDRLQRDLLAAKRSTRPAIPVVPAETDPGQWLAEQGTIRVEAEEYTAVPVLAAKVAANPPDNVFEADREGWMLCPRSAVRHQKTTFATRVDDDAMAPTIPESSLVGVDCSVRDPGKIVRGEDRLVAVRDASGACVVRQLESAERHSVFLPTNPSEKRTPIVWSPDADEECPLIGKVVFAFVIH